MKFIECYGEKQMYKSLIPLNKVDEIRKYPSGDEALFVREPDNVNIYEPFYGTVEKSIVKI